MEAIAAIADDDAVLRELIAEVLRDQGHDVVEAVDGTRLLAMLQPGDLALVIADLWMPGLSGEQVLRQQRSVGDVTPFVIITAAPPHVTAGLRSTEGLIVLVKPFTLDELLDAIALALNRRAGVG